MNKQLRLRNIVSSILITSVAAGAVVASSRAFAETADDDMSKLYLEATEASSAKDYATAVEKYKAYLQLDPESAEVKGELAKAEAALLESQNAGVAPAASAAAPAGKTFEKVLAQYEAVRAEAQMAIAEADAMTAKGDASKALLLLSEVDSALPENSSSSQLRDRIALSRQRAMIALRGESGQVVSERMTEQQTRVIRDRVLQARKSLDRARADRSRHMLPEAIKAIDEAKATLPNVTSTRELSQEIDVERALVYAEYFYDAVERRSPVEAETNLKMVKDLIGGEHKIYRQLAAFFAEWRSTPAAQNPATINPGFIKSEAEATELLSKGHAQYLYGDFRGALDTYNKVLLHLPDNAQAKSMQVRIHNVLANSGEYNREIARASLLADVSEKWNMARMFVPVGTQQAEKKESPVVLKMRGIKVPVSLRDAPLQRAIETLVELSQSYDPVGRGVDIVLTDQGKDLPPITLTLQQPQPLDKVLDIVLDNVNYTYEIKDDIVRIIPNTGTKGLETREFTLSPQVVKRMGGVKRSAGGSSSPFGSSGSEAVEENSEELIIRNFFERSAGCKWDGDKSLAYDATSNMLMVTQDRNTLDRIDKTILSMSVAETKQVNIEAKFIEVNNSTLNQLVSNWQLTRGEGNDMYIRAQTGNRTVADAHAVASTDSKTTIYTPGREGFTNADGIVYEPTEPQDYTVSQPPPQVTRQPNYGSGMGPTFTGVIGTVGDYDLRLILNAVSGSDGTDLMAAPSLTVVSEQEATIKIVQLLRWPQSYDDMQIQVSSSNNNNNNNNGNGGGASSVGITPGTPQFDEEATEVGIQMRVVPRVNKEEKTISLELSPEIKEFEGFVEYGGTAVAIASGTIVTTPAGFFQPVFNLRQVSTTVEIYDGGTMVIGGLTREEVRTVNDKVPILGDLPLIGSAFRSTGKSITKKNLLIFVTANLMARGGGTESGRFRGVSNGATYSNPSLFTSSGPIFREFDAQGEETVSGDSVDPTAMR